MHFSRVYVDGFKSLTDFTLELNEKLNVVVGDNETGKTSVLEAITLVLTRQYDGRTIDYVIDPYLFNATAVAEYFNKRRRGEHAHPPRIVIEAYFHDDASDAALAKLKGNNNTKRDNCPGLVLTISVNNDHVEALSEYAADDANPKVLPVEFYGVTWRSFTNNGVTLRNLPFRVATIDTSLARAY